MQFPYYWVLSFSTIIQCHCANSISPNRHTSPGPQGETIILAARYQPSEGQAASPRVRILSSNGLALNFQEGRRLLAGNIFPTCFTTDVGGVDPLDGSSSRELFGATVDRDVRGIVNTRRRIGRRPNGPRIFGLYGLPLSYHQLRNWARVHNFYVLLLACRDDDD